MTLSCLHAADEMSFQASAHTDACTGLWTSPLDDALWACREWRDSPALQDLPEGELQRTCQTWVSQLTAADRPVHCQRRHLPHNEQQKQHLPISCAAACEPCRRAPAQRIVAHQCPAPLIEAAWQPRHDDRILGVRCLVRLPGAVSNVRVCLDVNAAIGL